MSARARSRFVALLLAMLAGCGARTALDEPLHADDAGMDASRAPDAFVVPDAVPVTDAAIVPDAAVAPDAGTCAARFAGTWSGPVAELATITQTGDALHGAWLTNMRPDFFGMVSGVGLPCRAMVTFPDDRTYVATLAPGGCEIDWSNATVWIERGCSP